MGRISAGQEMSQVMGEKYGRRWDSKFWKKPDERPEDNDFPARTPEQQRTDAQFMAMVRPQGPVCWLFDLHGKRLYREAAAR